MPRHEDIEQFKRVLASYGAGPQAGTGTLTAGDATPAETEAEAASIEAPDELGDLGDLGDTGGPQEPGTGDEGAPPDIGDLLSSLGGELAGGSSAEPAQGDENLDLSALFGEEETRAVEHLEEAEAPKRAGRQKKPKPQKPPKQPKERRARRAEPEPSSEEEAALDELAAVPVDELAPLEEPAATDEFAAPMEELAAPEELSPAEELAAPEESVAAPEEFALLDEFPVPSGESAAPLRETAEPSGGRRPRLPNPRNSPKPSPSSLNPSNRPRKRRPACPLKKRCSSRSKAPKSQGRSPVTSNSSASCPTRRPRQSLRVPVPTSSNTPHDLRARALQSRNGRDGCHSLGSARHRRPRRADPAGGGRAGAGSPADRPCSPAARPPCRAPAPRPAPPRGAPRARTAGASCGCRAVPRLPARAQLRPAQQQRPFRSATSSSPTSSSTGCARPSGSSPAT